MASPKSNKYLYVSRLLILSIRKIYGNKKFVITSHLVSFYDEQLQQTVTVWNRIAYDEKQKSSSQLSVE